MRRVFVLSPLGLRLRRLPAICALTVAITLLAPAAPPTARAADAGLVLEAVGLLRERYVDPVDTTALLNGAVGGLRAALSTAGVSVELAEIPAGSAATAAETAFRTRFSGAVAAAGGRVSATTLAHAAIRAMTGTLRDSHTGFMTPDQYRERQLKQRRQAAFSGIGIVLMPREGRFYVRDVIPGTPAADAGLQALDRIVRVDNVPTQGLEVDQVSGMIRGVAGTTVAITVERPGRLDALTVPVVRAPIQIPSIFQARVFDGGIGYVALYQFVNRTGVDVRQTLERLLAEGMRALVLDVRANSGGFLHELTAVLNTLLPPGRPIFQETSRGGQTRTTRTFGVPTLPAHMPLVVLIDEGSASAAELLAAALREQGRATLIGNRTSGAVEASVLYELSDGSALSVTILRLASGLGRRLEGVGVSPDLPASAGVADYDRGRDAQFERAVQLARQRLGLSALPARGR